VRGDPEGARAIALHVELVGSPRRQPADRRPAVVARLSPERTHPGTELADKAPQNGKRVEISQRTRLRLLKYRAYLPRDGLEREFGQLAVEAAAEGVGQRSRDHDRTAAAGRVYGGMEV